MRRRRKPIPSTDNDRWYERYGAGGYFCLPRFMLQNVAKLIDNATFFVYVALASFHFEGNTTFASSGVAGLIGKDERGVRVHLADLETLGLIKREPLGRGYKILFLCPSRNRIKQGAILVEAQRLEKAKRREERREAAKKRDSE